MPAFGRQRQEDFYEFKASLVYRLSCRTARAFTKRNPVLSGGKRAHVTTAKERTKEKNFRKGKD